MNAIAILPRHLIVVFACLLMACLIGGAPACLATDAVRQTDVFVSGEDDYHTYRIPALTVAADGALIAICEGRVAGRGDSGDIDLVAKRSTDGGKSWSSQQIIWNDGANTCGNPCLVLDETTETLWLLMTHNHGADNEQEIKSGTSVGPRSVWVASSDDHGMSWSAPREITADVKRPQWTWYATGPGCGIQLTRGEHAGRLVIPCDYNDREARRFSHVIFSDDHGTSWRLGGVAPKDGVNECEVVELADGRLMLNMRNYERAAPVRQVAFSDDGGESWSDQRHDPALIEPVCQASIRRIEWPQDEQPGLIAFSNPASAKKRERLTVRGSFDDGQTWPAELVLHKGSAAYSCLARLPNGDIGCLYEADNYGRIAFARVPQAVLIETAQAKSGP